MHCWSCNGSGRVVKTVIGPYRSGSVEQNCETCAGTGKPGCLQLFTVLAIGYFFSLATPIMVYLLGCNGYFRVSGWLWGILGFPCLIAYYYLFVRYVMSSLGGTFALGLLWFGVVLYLCCTGSSARLNFDPSQLVPPDNSQPTQRETTQRTPITTGKSQGKDARSDRPTPTDRPLPSDKPTPKDKPPVDQPVRDKPVVENPLPTNVIILTDKRLGPIKATLEHVSGTSYEGEILELDPTRVLFVLDVNKTKISYRWTSIKRLTVPDGEYTYNADSKKVEFRKK